MVALICSSSLTPFTVKTLGSFAIGLMLQALLPMRGELFEFAVHRATRSFYARIILAQTISAPPQSSVNILTISGVLRRGFYPYLGCELKALHSYFLVRQVMLFICLPIQHNFYFS
jgi:hypothetical protein